MKYLILPLLLLTGCLKDPWTHTDVYCINGGAIDQGAYEGTMSKDNVNNKTYLNFRNELGRPMRVEITNDRNWICAEKGTNDVKDSY